MSPIHEPIGRLALGIRLHGTALLAGLSDPHDELMSLVWGPRFDRHHALQLLARQPETAARTLPAVLAAADDFDALHPPAQRQLRKLIVRHRALRAATVTMETGCATADTSD